MGAYLGKAIQKRKGVEGWYFKKQCCDMWDNKKLCYAHHFTFKEFILATNRCTDRHWLSQYELVDDWKYVNYVIDFKHIANAVKRLLSKLHDYGDVDQKNIDINASTTTTNVW